MLTPRLLESRFSLTEVRVLFELARSDERIASDLVEILDADPGYVSRILGSFEDEGLIARRQSPDDRRQWLVSLTSRGRRTFKTLDERSSRQVASMLDGVAEEDRRRLVSAMGTIQGILNPETGNEAPAFLLRTHRPGDIGMVTHRHGVVYADEHGWDERFEALVAEILVEFVRHHDPARERLWIAERDDEFAGSIMCVDAGKGVSQLRLLLVDPRARGHGLGGHLVNECIRFARRAGYREMILWTQSCLDAARHLYEKAGFCLEKEQKHCSYGPELVEQWWRKEL